MKTERYSDIARFEIGKCERGPKLSGQTTSQFGRCFTLVWALADIYHDVLRRQLARRRRLTPAERQGVSSAPNWPRRRGPITRRHVRRLTPYALPPI